MLNDRSRAKSAAAAQQLLPAGRQVTAYVVGRGHARLTPTATVVTLLFGVVFAVGMMFGMVIYPGVALIVFVFGEVRPPRGLAVTDDGIALVARSRWMGRPSRLLATVAAPRVESSSLGFTTLDVGPERVSFGSGEIKRLAATGRVVGLGVPGGQQA